MESTRRRGSAVSRSLAARCAGIDPRSCVGPPRRGSVVPVKQAVLAVRSGDVASLEAALLREPSLARGAQLVLEAARGARLDALRLLVGHGADPNATWRGYRPLHALIQERPHGETEPSRERLRCLEWLLAHGADPELPGAWPPARAILIAAFMGAEPVVDRLRAAGARVDAFAACALGKAGAVKWELARNPGFANARDAQGLTPLQCCAASRMGAADRGVSARLLEIATVLLDSGADPNARTSSWSHEVDAVYFAVGSRQEAILALLLERKADATAALTSAVWNGYDALAEIALRHGAEPNGTAEGGRPLLNDLVRWGQVRAALWLLAHGADPNRPDPEGWTALHQAASRGSARLVRALRDAGGDSSRRDLKGRTPLDIAGERGRAAAAAVLSPARRPVRS